MTPFDDLHDYLAVPRVSELRLSPDGCWLAAAVQQVSPDGKKYTSSIWRIDTGQSGAGDRAAVRLTRSAEGEDSPAFLPDGSLLFRSARPGPPASPPAGEDADPKPALWLLPPGGGEARRIIAPPGGVARLGTARDASRAVFSSPVLPGTSGTAEDAKRRQARAAAGVTAILHEAAPVRYWDHDLGPDELRLLVAGIGDGQADGAGADGGPAPQDLTTQPGRALDEHHFELTPDGTRAVTGWAVPDGTGGKRHEVAVIDGQTGQRRTLLSAPGYDFGDPRVSPDGRSVLCIRETHVSYADPADLTLVVAPLDGSGSAVDLLAGLDRWPQAAAWSADSGCVYFTAADNGRCPIFRAEPGTGAITRLTADDGAYDSLCPAPDGRFLYALRAAIDSPPEAVRLDVTEPGAPPHRLPGPAAVPELPGRLTEIEAAAEDGSLIRGWLTLPHGASADAPAPLLLWVHGGPLASWNSWSWRWNPWLMTARGYAVLLPDPALSTGYGRDFIARGHGEWGARPFADLMTITDAAAARPDIEETRTAAMGGSFGGYMANWIAGHTDRFRAIVSHASLWALDQMFGTTDSPAEWRRHFGTPGTHPERYAANSPHLHAASIRTPMLVIHGDKDYRVPIGEALRLWADLRAAPSAEAKFLYFPDENHWVLSPGNAVIWYETVLAFLAQHVLGEPWHRPDLL